MDCKAVQRFGAALLVLLAACACQKQQPMLTREMVKALVESSAAFQSPMNPDITFVDAAVSPGGKRELLKLEGLVVKEDGPFAAAGHTATASFSWRWTGGPLAGPIYHSKVKLNTTSGAWKVYDDLLQKELWRAEAGEE